MKRDDITNLQDILKLERNALLHGHYDALTEITKSKQAVLMKLDQDRHQSASLEVVKSLISENQRLTAAALRGISVAKERIATLKQIRDGLTIYDPSGKVSMVKTQCATFEKKA